MKSIRSAIAVAAAALLAAGCGGGGADTTPRQSFSSVVVFGDSLADVGTFGYKFTVQGTGLLIYPERIAQTYGVAALCPFLLASSETAFAPNPAPGCSDFAVGGAQINFPSAPTSPYSIQVQLATAAAARGGFKASDLLVIDGGGNDAAAVVTAYLAASTDGGASFIALVSTLLPAATVQAQEANGATGLATLGGLYMAALADTLVASIQTNAIANGAQNIVVLNLPAILVTPEFEAAMAQVTAAEGAAVAAQLSGLFGTWFQGYNSELAAKVKGNSAIVLTDFYTAINDEVNTPAQYGLTNVTVPACSVIGTDSLNLCSAAALSAATPPAGSTGGANWWTTYAFSNSFHPTPYGHQLIAQRISLDLAASGRL